MRVTAGVYPVGVGDGVSPGDAVLVGVGVRVAGVGVRVG